MPSRFTKEFRRERDLLWLITKKEITLKYKRTILGIFWSLLNPIILSIVLYIAFQIFLRINIPNYPFFVLSALFPWTWFSVSVVMASGTLIENAQLIKKVRLQKHYFVLATVFTQSLNFLLAIPVIIALALLYNMGPQVTWLLGIPVLGIVQLMMITGISMTVSVLNAYFRDMEYIIMMLINFLFWLTPIIYPLASVPEAYQIYLAFNPLTYLIVSWRDLFMNGVLDWGNIGLSALTSLACFFSGILVFKKYTGRLDEFL
jgi:lipopolysaccharide transport system permease protein